MIAPVMTAPVTTLLLALLATCGHAVAPLAPGSGENDPFVRFELPGGVRLAVLHVQDAPRQSTFTFLPLGLVSDAPGQAQFAHLVEHMLIRSTDPDSLEPTGMQINGETTSAGLRLDTYAETDHWRASLERHVAWLTAREFFPDVLEREQGRIAGEERTTVAGGYTHKWADAAWHQVVAHGRKHAALLADVAGASLEDLRGCVERWVHIGPDVTIASVGPIDPEEIRDVLAKALGKSLDEGEEGATTAPASRRPPTARAQTRPASYRATWDLAAHHYLEWYPLPDRNPADRVAAHAAAQIALMSLARDASLGNGRALASTVATVNGRYLVLSASLSGPDAVADAQRAFESAFESALEGARTGAGMSLRFALRQLELQAASVPDPALARKQMKALGMDASLVEAQLALNLINLERSLGLARAEILAGWKALDVDRMESFLDGLSPDKRSTLLLSPQSD